MNKDNFDFYNDEPENIDFRNILDKYLKYWKWFAFSAGVFVFLGMIYLSFKESTYKAVATIIISDEKSKGQSSGSAFADLSLLSGISTSSIENELGLLRSNRLMNNAVKALNLNVKYTAVSGFFKEEYYKNSPFVIKTALLDSDLLKKAMRLEVNSFIIKPLNEKEVEISIENSETTFVSKIGEIVDLEYIKFFVEPNEIMDYRVDNDGESKGVRVTVHDISRIASSLSKSLSVGLVDKNSTMIQLGLVDNFQQRAKDVLDQLVFEYNQEAIEDKDLIARNTAFFIDERLAIINSELDSVETGKEKFKESNLLTDIEAESQLIVKNVSDYNNEQQRIGTELELTNALIKHLRNNKSSLLPANIGIEDIGISGLIEEFNSNVLERDRLLKSASDQNPLVVSLNEQIAQIRENVMESLMGMRSNLGIKKNNLDRQSGVLASQMSDVPAQERAYRGIERQQNIKEALYLFLLQKREENSLSLAASAPKAKIVDKAYSTGIPVSPNTKNVMLMALIAGLFFPFLSINVIFLLNDKVMNGDDVKELSDNISFLGEMPHVLSNESMIVNANERTALSESFNVLASNVQLEIEKKGKEDDSISIFVTSSLKGEGKTFTAVNLGLSLATTGKKVVVIGGDLRNPQLHRFQEDSNYFNGLSRYLSIDEYKLKEFIEDSSLNENLKFLYAGKIPNNPIELLKKSKMKQMFLELKKEFDFIIVDTAPVLHLADTFVMSKYADLTLFVLKASVTKKKFVGIAEEMGESGKLKNLYFVLNDVKLKDMSYGYGYDYDYGS